MPTITVRLGTMFRPMPHIMTITVSDEDGHEFDPEAVFKACNRINELDADRNNLPFAWQKMMREMLDFHAAPSMSVGDSFAITTPRANLGTWTCNMVGWTHTHDHD